MSESCRVFPQLTISLWVFLHHIVLLTARARSFKRRFHSIPIAQILPCDDGIRIALNFSESNVEEGGSQSIEEQ